MGKKKKKKKEKDLTFDHKISLKQRSITFSDWIVKLTLAELSNTEDSLKQDNQMINLLSCQKISLKLWLCKSLAGQTPLLFQVVGCKTLQHSSKKQNILAILLFYFFIYTF